MSFLSYIKEGKFAKTNAMIVTALKEKTLSLIESEKLRVAASLFEDAPKAIHTDRTYGSHGAHLQDLGEPVGYTARHTNVPSPYAYSPTDTIHHWKGKHVFSRETSHKKFQTFEVPKDSKIHKNEDDASDEHIRKTYPHYQRVKEAMELGEASGIHDKRTDSALEAIRKEAHALGKQHLAAGTHISASKMLDHSHAMNEKHKAGHLKKAHFAFQQGYNQGHKGMSESEVTEASPAMAQSKPFSLPRKAAQPKAPAVAGKTGKWGKWSDNDEDRMPYDYSNYGNHPGARKSAIADFSESDEPLTQAHIDASYQKVLKAKRAHEKAANAGYGKRTNTPGAMNDKDSNIRHLQDAHHAAAVSHKALVKRFESQGGK